MENWTGEYSCDGGSLRIYTSDIAFRILNEVGDGTFKVNVNYTDKWSFRNGKFTGTFIVKTISYISGYDLEDNEIYTLPTGWYSIYTHNNGDITLVWCDEV